VEAREVSMPIRYVAGDLFANAARAQALAHGCNCEGSMGAGVAVGFRERYPAMYERYRAMCKAQPRQFNLGDAWLFKAKRRPWVFNLATQERYWRCRATYEAVESALASMRRQAEGEDVTRIAMPRIGAGLGGLSWKKVREIIDRVFDGWPGTLTVYEEYVPGATKLSSPSK
jgi:O-acetyl-ADP-ribose deacetylase (regulator of RNase III)